jgi:DNA-binding SARP family transcriptional activator/tRNA A-37 threonylcarbamoyl transferase component Bud32
MEFRILGPLEVSAGDGALKVGGPKQRAVLAHLILRANRPVPVDLLIDSLWGEEPPETAKNTLQTYVYRLRQLLGEDRIASANGGYVLRAEPSEIDAARFEALVRAAKAELSTDPSKAADELARALTLWRGSPLADLSDEPSLRGEIARLEELHLSATEHRIAAEIAVGGHSTVVSELEALTARYPLRERMWANLMLALYRLGRQAEALAAYQRAREVLADELGAEPSAKLQRLHEQILRRDPSLGAKETPKPIKPSRVDLQPGSEFAGYRIVSTLGRGGMAVVYLAEHDFLQRKVALKVLAPQLAEDERFRERFVRESRLAASLDHPNVVPIYEAGASGGDLFIAMRYVEGTDLRTLLTESGALDPARAVSITRQVAAALDAAHEQGLVHRDVKPGNVLVARTRGSEASEHVYLSDFGLTKRSTSESGVTGTGQFVGTLDYAAPEQFQGGTPDARTDVYSMGCVLFECLTGHPPFRSENDAGLMYAHLQQQPPSVTADRPDLPKEIDEVIARAMAKAPGNRQPSAGTLADEATRALHVGVPGEAGADGRGSLLRRLAPVLAVAAALVVGIVVASLVQSETPEAAGATGSASPTSSPNPTVPPTFRTVDRALSDPERQLLTFIPPDVKGDCLPLDRPEPLHGERATLVCRTAELEVLYQLFQTRDEMNEAFEINVNNQQAPDGDCSADTVAIGTYAVGGKLAGQVLCYTIERGPFFEEGGGFAESLPDQSHIEWTDENASIYGHAIRNDLADRSLFEWWLSSSGPMAPGAVRASPKDPPPGAATPRLDDGTYLAAPRRGCAGFPGTTCGLHIDGTLYEDAISGQSLFFTASPNEIGEVLLQKPDRVVFSPDAGYCLSLPNTNNYRSAAYHMHGIDRFVTFEPTQGGPCAGPQKLAEPGEPWTRAPSGSIALSREGEVALVDPGGYEIEPLTADLPTTPNKNPDWSPDGSTIVFAGAVEHDDLFLMNADGSNVRRLTHKFGNEYDPVWSPDGTRIAFAYDDLRDSSLSQGPSGAATSIVVIDAEGGEWTTIFTRRGEYFGWPAWSPDGQQVAFSGEDENGYHLYVMDADGSDLREIRHESKGLVAMPVAWQPDGERIVFWGTQAGEDTLLSIRPDGTGVRKLLEDLPEDAQVLTVDWSPGGRWIVAAPIHDLTAVTSAPSPVYLIRSDGSDVFAISGLGYEPAWRTETP